MKRDVKQLADRKFDVLVIGGGIYGSWIALHAARCNLRVALIDKGDWGSGTSSASSKLFHGGLRYLEYFKWGLVRKSLHERGMLNRLAPHQVRPLRFFVPTYCGQRVSRLKLKAGLWLYDRLAGADQPVGPHTSLSKTEMKEAAPFLEDDGLTGGFEYGDCGTDDSRFVVEIVDSAIRASACAANYVQATHLLVKKGKILGASVKDQASGDCFELSASIVVNAAGPWAAGLMTDLDVHISSRLTKGVHLVLPRLPTDQAFLLTAKQDGRVFFLIPWYGRTLLGTTDTDYARHPNDLSVTPRDVDYLFKAVGDYLSSDHVNKGDLRGSFCGLRTLRNEVGKSASSVSREWSLEHPVEGLFVPLGGKLTSARVEARATVEQIMQVLGRNVEQPPTELAWYPGRTWKEWVPDIVRQGLDVGLDKDMAESCARRYGANALTVFGKVRERPDLAKRIVPDLPFTMAECVHAAENEMARTLLDVLRRRVPLAILEPLGKDVIEEVARAVGDVLGWDDVKRESEVESVKEHTTRPCS